MTTLHRVYVLKDNYVWILANSDLQAVIVDPGEADPVIDYLEQNHLEPIGILLTHHHSDHVDGVTQLKHHYPKLTVFGPSEVPFAINDISCQEKLIIGDFEFTVVSVPGHTKTHVAYYSKPYLFSGDCLFSGGCGRLLGGTYEQMLSSLNKLKQLPDETQICAGHEYTFANLQFAHKMMPEDISITQYMEEIRDRKVTLPTFLYREKRINLFLNCDNQIIQNKFNYNNELEMFVFFRIQKDKF